MISHTIKGNTTVGKLKIERVDENNVRLVPKFRSRAGVELEFVVPEETLREAILLKAGKTRNTGKGCLRYIAKEVVNRSIDDCRQKEIAIRFHRVSYLHFVFDQDRFRESVRVVTVRTRNFSRALRKLNKK